MNDPNSLLCQVIREAQAVGIPVSRLISPEVMINSRAKTRFGLCRKNGLGWVIEISSRLLSADEFACRRTLAHEVLHTCRGCQNHGALWKEYAARMNAAYGYGIRRTDTPEALGIADERIVRYRLSCQKCGAVVERSRRSALISHPERYRCKCGGAFSFENV